MLLALRGAGAINNSSDLTIERGGRLNIQTNAGTTHTVRNLTGGGDLQPNSDVTVEINRSGVRFDGRLQTIPGSVTKQVPEAWTLTNPDSRVLGGVTVAEGAWIMDGGSFDGKAPWSNPSPFNRAHALPSPQGTTTNTGTFNIRGACRNRQRSRDQRQSAREWPSQHRDRAAASCSTGMTGNQDPVLANCMSAEH